MRLGELLQERAGNLRAANPRFTAALRAAVQRALESRGTAPSTFGDLVVLPRSGRLPYLAMIMPMIGAGAVAVGAIVVLHDPEQKPTDATQLLSRVFNLTTAEAAVSMALLEGHPMRTIARQRNSSVNTVRTLLYQAFRKTGTRRQAEFIRLLIPLLSMQSMATAFLAVKELQASDDRPDQFTQARMEQAIGSESRRVAGLDISTMVSIFTPGASTPVHYAAGPEIVYVQEGTLGMEIGGEVTVSRAGQVMHVAQEVVHRAFNPSTNESAKVLVMHFKREGEPHRVNL